MIKLLDHGFIRLLDHMGDDTAISNNARVIIEPWRGERDIGLLRYLWKNGHTTPYEGIVFKFEIQAPILVFRQWHRHRTQSYNEISARYEQLQRLFYVPEEKLIGLQSEKNHQSRDMKLNPNAALIREIIEESCNHSFDKYEQLLKLDCPREIARSPLPVNTYSRMIVTANLLNWFRFLDERMDEHAQYEIRVYANAIYETIKQFCPVAVGMFEESRIYDPDKQIKELQTLISRIKSENATIGYETGNDAITRLIEEWENK